MEVLSGWLRTEFFDIAIYQYALAFLAILAGFTMKRASKAITDRLMVAAGRTRFRFDALIVTALSPPLGWAFVLGGLYLATMVLPLPEKPVDVRFFVGALVRAASGLVMVWFVMRLVDESCKLWMEKAKDTETKLDDQFIPIVRSSSKVFLSMIGVILVLQNLGYSVTSLIAGLGIGGMAIALASQDTISNLFGSLVIFMDRPFQIGDWIVVGDVEGTVEEVGMRTTRIRTFANSLITLPNSKLTTSSVNNWSRMKKRRIKTSIGLTYDSPPEKVEAAVNMIRELIKNDPAIRDDFFLVNFNNFGPSSLDIFIYCFTHTTNWAEFMQAQQNFYLNIMRGIHEIGLSFAFPTQSIHVESMPPAPGPGN